MVVTTNGIKIIIPPIVGTPIFLRCSLTPSSLTVWPICLVFKLKMTLGAIIIANKKEVTTEKIILIDSGSNTELNNVGLLFMKLLYLY
jgi:hypothetical protein